MLTSEQVELIRRGIRARETTRDRARLRGLERVEIEVVDGLSYRAQAPAEPGATMTVGEPVERGGDGRGNSPLAHVLAGAGSCLLNQFIRISIAESLDLRFTGARIRAEFHRNVGAGIERIRTEVHAEGELPADRADWLTERAESFCYVHNTLARAIPMTTVLVLNGVQVACRESGPDIPANSPGTGRA